MRRNEGKQGGARYKVSCIFVEKRAAFVSASTTSYGPCVANTPEIETFPLKGDFWEQIEKVGDLVGDDPALVFLDPFGLKDLKFDLLAELCNRLPNVDLMLNFASPAARRLEKNNSDWFQLLRAVPDGWTTESLTQIFCDRLQADAVFLSQASSFCFLLSPCWNLRGPHNRGMAGKRDLRQHSSTPCVKGLPLDVRRQLAAFPTTNC